MPYGGGIFLPSETAYKDPGRFRDVLEAEGSKQARYLAEMDQFFAQLEEMKRQFDITAEMKERFFEEEMAFREEELEWKAGESALDRALRRWEVGETLGVRREELSASERASARAAGLEERRMGLEADIAKKRLGFEEKKLGFEETKTGFMMGLYGAQERRTQEAHETARKRIEGEDRYEWDPEGFYSKSLDITEQYIPSWA